MGEPGGGPVEGDVVELLGQGWGAGAEAEGEPSAGEVVEGGGHHGDRGGAASPDRCDAGGDADAGGLEGDLGEDDAGVEPPPFGDEDGVVAELVGEDGGVDDEMAALLHRGEHEGPLGTGIEAAQGHDVGSWAMVNKVEVAAARSGRRKVDERGGDVDHVGVAVCGAADDHRRGVVGHRLADVDGELPGDDAAVVVACSHSRVAAGSRGVVVIAVDLARQAWAVPAMWVLKGTKGVWSR